MASYLGFTNIILDLLLLAVLPVFYHLIESFNNIHKLRDVYIVYPVPTLWIVASAPHGKVEPNPYRDHQHAHKHHIVPLCERVLCGRHGNTTAEIFQQGIAWKGEVVLFCVDLSTIFTFSRFQVILCLSDICCPDHDVDLLQFVDFYIPLFVQQNAANFAFQSHPSHFTYQLIPF